MFLILFASLVLAADTIAPQYVADLGVERAKLVARMAADQARIDQIDGELRRLTGTIIGEAVYKPVFRVVSPDPWLGGAEKIKGVLDEHASLLQSCYNHRTVGTKGSFVVTVESRGDMSQLMLKNASTSSYEGASISDCWSEAFAGTSFPRPPPGQPYTVKFIFE